MDTNSSNYTVCGLDELKDRIQQNKVICFGRSMAFRSFSYFMNSLGIDDRIDFIVDNDESVWGTVVPGYDKEWSVISPENIRGRYNTCIIVITVGREENALTIARQLTREYGIDKDRIVYYLPAYNEWISQKKRTISIPNDVRILDKPAIPKTIHYCWFGGKPIPDHYKRWMDTWKKVCPDYEIVRWDESNYDVTKNKYMKRAYEAGNFGFVTDYARLDIVYNNGGIYFDTDVEIIKPLDELLYEYGFAGYLPDERIATGLGLGAVKGLEIIGRLMNDYDTRSFCDASNEKERISVSLCSEIQTEYLLRNPSWRYTNGIVDMDGLRVYPSPVFDGLNTDDESRAKYSYTIHHFAGSWLSEDR